MEASLCVVKRKPLFWHVCPCFLIYLCVLNEAGIYTAISELTLLGKAIGEWQTGHHHLRKSWVQFFHAFGLCSSHTGVLQRNRLQMRGKSMPWFLLCCCTVSVGTLEILWAASFLVSVSSLTTGSIWYSQRINFWGVFENRAY